MGKPVEIFQHIKDLRAEVERLKKLLHEVDVPKLKQSQDIPVNPWSSLYEGDDDPDCPALGDCTHVQETKAQVERLTALVEAAYREGIAEAIFIPHTSYPHAQVTKVATKLWLSSKACAALGGK